MTAFFHVWHWLRSTDVLLAATLTTILGATILYTLARTTPGVRPGAPRDRINDLNGVNAWRERDEAILRGELHAAAGRLFPDPPAHDGDGPSPAWPPDLCHFPPCEPEDNWGCVGHQGKPMAERVGKHRAVWQGSLDDQPATVIVQAVTDVPYRRRPR